MNVMGSYKSAPILYLPDLVNIGLGRFYRNPSHSPFTSGHLPATQTFSEQYRTQIAGLDVEFYPAPSDATDSVNIWFPELDLAINNILWPKDVIDRKIKFRKPDID